MIKKDKEKQFDCIKMKSIIQKQINNETKNMSQRDLLHYFNDNNKYLESNRKQRPIGRLTIMNQAAK